MEKMSKVLSLPIVMILSFVLILSGCGQSADKPSAYKDLKESTVAQSVAAETGNKTTEHVKLKMYFLGEPAPDNEKVFSEISKKLTEKINAELEPSYLSWGDWDKRYPLLFSSGEDFDMIYTANWAFYSDTASKGGFYELTQDMLNEYCPQIMKNHPKEVWASTKVAGKNYMIPNDNFFANHYGIILRGDLREKYGLPEVKNVQDLEKYMDAVLANEKGMVPLDVSKDNAEMLVRAFVLYPEERYYLNAGTLTYDFTDPKVFNLKPYYEVDGYLDHLKRMMEWNKKGYLSKSDLTTANSKRFEAGKSAIKIDNLAAADAHWQKAKANYPDWKVEYVNLLEGKKLCAQGANGNGLGFNARSKNIERALMAVDLLHYDPDINFLMNYGLPDIHNKIAGKVTMEGREFPKVQAIDTAKFGGISNWCFTDAPVFPVESFPHYNELAVSYFYKQKVEHPLDGFTFVSDQVNTEVANTTSIIQEYLPILYLGFNKDAEKTLHEFVTKIKAAGIDRVNEEVTAQAKKIFGSTQ
jgi:putative aldouronate transport system substrate-binding protein